MAVAALREPDILWSAVYYKSHDFTNIVLRPKSTRISITPAFFWWAGVIIPTQLDSTLRFFVNYIFR